MVNPRDFERIARLGLFMSCYVANSVEDSEAVARAYGEEVANTFLSPLNSMIKAGVKVVFETDRASYIWTDLERGVTRKDLKGKVWGAQERVDKPTALRMVTSWAAEYVLKPDQLGMIQKGKLADLLVLDRDYLTIPDDDISEIQPLLTVMDGKVVFVHTRFAGEYNFRPTGAVVSTYNDLIQRRRPSEIIAGAGG
jgi:predicted amidohydrolase YtcJ